MEAEYPSQGGAYIYTFLKAYTTLYIGLGSLPVLARESHLCRPFRSNLRERMKREAGQRGLAGRVSTLRSRNY